MQDGPDSIAQLPNVGFIGIGRMGLPMCDNLVQAGYPVVASDARHDRETAAVACGAHWSPTTADAAAETLVFITMLPSPQEVHKAMLGTGGALDALPPGATWIDMTSNSPAVVAPIRERAYTRGVEVLEAPVGGGIRAAREGTLQLFVAGQTPLFQRHRPLLEILGDPERITLVGGHGAGYTAKLLVNLLWFGQAVATAEALLLARSAGIDPDVLRGTLQASAAASDFIRRDLDALFAGDYLQSFGLDRICEELETVTSLAREHHVPFELSHLIEALYLRALDHYGPADGELLAIAMLEQQAGLRLRRPT